MVPLCPYHAPVRGEMHFRRGQRCIINSAEGVVRVPHLIEFLELYNLKENVFHDVFRIPLIFV